MIFFLTDDDGSGGGDDDGDEGNRADDNDSRGAGGKTVQVQRWPHTSVFTTYHCQSFTTYRLGTVKSQNPLRVTVYSLMSLIPLSSG